MRPARGNHVAFLVVAALALSVVGAAQEFEPRTSAVAPVGINVIALGYGFAMVAYPISPTQGVSLSIGSGGNAGAGTDFDAVTLGYQFAWGS